MFKRNRGKTVRPQRGGTGLYPKNLQVKFWFLGMEDPAGVRVKVTAFEPLTIELLTRRVFDTIIIELPPLRIPPSHLNRELQEDPRGDMVIAQLSIDTRATGLTPGQLADFISDNQAMLRQLWRTYQDELIAPGDAAGLSDGIRIDRTQVDEGGGKMAKKAGLSLIISLVDEASSGLQKITGSMKGLAVVGGAAVVAGMAAVGKAAWDAGQIYDEAMDTIITKTGAAGARARRARAGFQGGIQ